jgi:hypothetical protein
MALIQEANGWRAVQGIVLFRDRSLDPKTLPWNRIIHTFSLNELQKEGQEGEAIREAVLIVLQTKFGDLPPDVYEPVQGLSLQKSKEELSLAVRWDRLDLVRSWLAENPK